LSDPSKRRILTIVNKRGLHARASARFVKCVEEFDADIRVGRGGHVVGGTSIMGLMMLAAGEGSRIEITASGPEAEAALAALESMVLQGFGETD